MRQREYHLLKYPYLLQLMELMKRVKVNKQGYNSEKTNKCCIGILKKTLVLKHEKNINETLFIRQREYDFILTFFN